MARVAISGVTLRTVMMIPLRRPMRAASAMQARIASGVRLSAPSMMLVERIFTRVTIPAWLRSMPPTRRASVWPVASTPRKAATCRMFSTWLS